MNSVTVLPDVHLQRLVLENVSDIIVITDLTLTVQSWNHIAEEFYGIPASEAIGRCMKDVVSFEYYDSSEQEALQALLAHKIWKGEVCFTSASGEAFCLSQTVKFVTDEAGKEVGIMAVGRNITEQKRAAEQLAQSEGFYRTLIADALDVTLLVNAAGEITFATPSLNRLLGYSPEDVKGTNAFLYVHPDDLGWASQSFTREVEEDPDIKFILVRIRKKSGGWLWCMARGHNLLETPHVQSIVLYLHDDTPRKQATDALKENEKRFRVLVRDLQVGVLLQDAEGKILLTNNVMTRMFALTEEQILGGKIWELCGDAVHEDGSPFRLSDRPSFKAMQSRQLVKDVVMGVRSKRTHEYLWILVSADPVLDGNDRLLNIVCSFIDITERKKLEKKSTAEKLAHQRQLAQATLDGQEQERLEIGRELHDNIGQQLTSIKLFLDFAKTTANADTIALLEMSLKSVANAIDDVRTMSRSLVPPTLKDLGFIDSVNDLIDSLRTTQPVEFTLDYIDFDEERLTENRKLALYRIIQEQLNNVVKYANAGKVTICLYGSDGQISLTIADDGIGFDLDTVRRGLGLTNIANRSELLGGRTEIDTAPGKGCRLDVWIPYEAPGCCPLQKEQRLKVFAPPYPKP